MMPISSASKLGLAVMLWRGSPKTMVPWGTPILGNLQMIFNDIQILKLEATCPPYPSEFLCAKGAQFAKPPTS